MSNISDLKDALTTAAANITDDIDRLECLSDIDSWYDVRLAVDALTSNSVKSYSIGGRSVTREDLSGLKAEAQELYERIKQKLYYRGAGLLDARGSTWTGEL